MSLNFHSRFMRIPLLLGLLAAAFSFFPCFVGHGPSEISSVLTLQSGESVRLWNPPGTSEALLLQIRSQSIGSLSCIGNDGKRDLWKSGKSRNVAHPLSDLPFLGKLTVSGPPGASVSVRIIGGPTAASLLLYIIALALLFLFFRRKVSGTEKPIFFGAVLLRFVYGFFIPWYRCSPDVHGHVQYIILLIQNWTLPPAGAGIQCYQPPPYYLFSGMEYRIAQWLEFEPTDFLRIVSLLLSCVFLFFGLKSIRLLLRNSRCLSLSMILFAFWPAGIYLAPIINNDVPVNALGAISFYLLLRWRVAPSPRWFISALACAGLAALFKTSGAVYFAPIILAFLENFHRSRKFPLKEGILILGGLALTMAFMQEMNFQRSRSAEGDNAIVGNINRLERDVQMFRYSRSVIDFLPGFAQIESIVSLNPSQDIKGVYYRGYWPPFGRSAVKMGEMARNVPFGELQMHFLLLLLIIPAGCALFGAVRHPSRDAVFLAACVLCFLAASMAFRWEFPYTSSADLRYVIGLIIPLSALAAMGLYRLQAIGASRFWKVLFLLFPLCSFFIYLEISLSTVP